MAREKQVTEKEAEKEISVWLGDAQQNIKDSVTAFTAQWEPWPRFDIGVEVMTVFQLRNAIGIRLSEDYGDPWPSVERLLLDAGYRWQTLGGQRVMFLKERDGFTPDTGWEYGEEVCETEGNEHEGP